MTIKTTSSRGLHAWSVGSWGLAATVASVLVLLVGGVGWATPPGGGVQTLAPPSAPPSAPPRSPGGGFNWQGLVEDMGRQLLQPRYPEGGRYPPGTGGGHYQTIPPQYSRPIPSRRYPPPRYEPNYVQPPPMRVVPQDSPRVAPPENQLVVRVPPQNSPLIGRTWEVSVREARCYAHGLEQMVHRSLTSAMDELAPGKQDLSGLEGQLSTLRELLKGRAPWREIEPHLRELIESNQARFSRSVLGNFEHVVRLIMVRDAFLLVGNAEPRGRGVALPIDAIPTGEIWVVLDPTLIFGSGLLVNGGVMVCGSGGHGGRGELEIVYTSAAAALGLPVAAGEPLPDIAKEEAREASDFIVIRHREQAATAVNYVLNRRQTQTLQPGEEQRLPLDQSWTIEFDRGAGHGSARYSLPKGSYEFRIVDGRWDLKRLKFAVKIDNREGKTDFEYVLENEIINVPAGEIKEHTSLDSIVVEFDRGQGPEEPARKNLNKSGTYKVAVDTGTNYLDLFSVGKASEGSEIAADVSGSS